MTEAQPSLYERILFSKEEVDERIAAVAADIRQDERYAEESPLFVGLLRGANPFLSKLMFAIADQDVGYHPEVDYMAVRTYGLGREAKAPSIAMHLAPGTKLTGRSALIVDDVLDTGLTAAFTHRYLKERGARDVGLCVLAQKQLDRPPEYWQEATFKGFETPGDAWLTGMGMDDARLGVEANRWFGGIAIAND